MLNGSNRGSKELVRYFVECRAIITVNLLRGLSHTFKPLKGLPDKKASSTTTHNNDSILIPHNNEHLLYMYSEYDTIMMTRQIKKKDRFCLLVKEDEEE